MRRDPSAFVVPPGFWGRPDTTVALAGRDIGALFLLLRRHAGASQTGIMMRTGIAKSEVSAIMHGRPVTTLARLQAIADGLGMPDRARVTLGIAPRSLPGSGGSGRLTTRSGGVELADLVGAAEALQGDLVEAVSGEALPAGSLDDWERVIRRHGRATRHRGSRAVLSDLLADVAQLDRLLRRRRPSSTVRELTGCAARLAGLVALTLIKLGEAQAARGWTRVAQLAAAEAGDPRVRSWVWAQEAYLDYYRGDFAEAVSTAQRAQRAAGGSAAVGVPLAAALEARAHAALGRRRETREAVARAEGALARLEAEELVPSAFGYDEAQLRFHEGSALTHLGDVAAAAAHERALELYPEQEYLDRALVRLDQARCLARRDEPVAAVSLAAGTLSQLQADQRDGLILQRARDLLNDLPVAALPRTGVHELRELLAAGPDR